MKCLLIAVLALSFALAAVEAFAEQKRVACGEGYRFKPVYFDDDSGNYGKTICGRACTTRPVEDYLGDGWKIDTNQPTTFVPKVSDNMAKDINKAMNERKLWGAKENEETVGLLKNIVNDSCVCTGTQYVLSREEKKIEVTPEPDKNSELMKKEIELLKKENDMLKKDSEALKQENEALKKKVAKKK